ncbi:MAG: radical SAM protein [Acidimicrobiales bacterium]|nr:radical SAM protein [Acidimicrobiales bacterium]
MADAGSGDTLEAGDGTLVVRAIDRWAVTPARRHDARWIDTEELLALLGEDPTAVGELPEPLGEGTVLEPHPVVVGRLAGGALVLEAADGEPLPLDRLDLRLLATIDRWVTVAEVLDAVTARLGDEAPDRTRLCRRLARLADAGRVQVPRREAPPAAPETGPDTPVPSVLDTHAEGPVVETAPAPAPADAPKTRRWWGRRRNRPTSSAMIADAASPDAPDPASAAQDAGITAAPADDAIDPVPPPTDAPAPTDARSVTDAAEARGEGSGPASEPVPAGGAAYGGVGGNGLTAPFTYLDDPFPGGPAGPVPVYAVWPVETGPVLALGMLTAAARTHDGGGLSNWYEIRRQEEPASFLADLAGRDGPAVVLLSNYVWSLDRDLDLARKARELCPGAVIIHGGPSTPKYPGDVDRFFAEHEGLVDVTVRGEGEDTLVAILEALGPTFPAPELDRLRDVPGLSYRDPATGAVVRTDDRDRIADLDALPSPYLTGEFDHLPADAWNVPSGLLGLIFESNRGCPYGCTFCDWGSSTLSRIRKFDMERVDAEMRWAAERGLHAWTITDANFGIIARDVEIAERMGALKQELGNPRHFGFNVAKNTTKHLTAILDRLVEAGVIAHFSLAMQTRDQATLDAVERTNISTDHYLALAAAFRRRGLPLDADVMVGLPGQTVDSFAEDLQFCIDHEIPARMWITELLPNAPMNDPAYRERWGIETDEHEVVVATSTFSREDRRTMMRLRHAYTAFERFGILRHVVRYAQWDHGVPAMAVIGRIVERSEHDPERYPLLNWVARYFDFFNAVPVGWSAFFAEVGTFLEQEFGIGPSADRDAVLAAQSFVLPDLGRRFPATLDLPHDVAAYERDHTRGLWADGTPSRGGRLADYGPAPLTVYGDPLDSCGHGITVNEDPRNEVLTERFWIVGHWELDSPLVANVPEVAAAASSFVGLHEARPADLADEELTDPGVPRPTPVVLGATPVRATGA